MIAPDDPRHGTNRGYNQGCHEQCCRHAHAIYQKRRGLGYSHHYIDATGTRRRLEALAALGHSIVQISLDLGRSRTYASKLMENPKVRSDNAQTIAEIYDRLSMTLATGPLAERSRRAAAAKGWVGPLAWNDIDTDPEPPTADQPVRVDHAAIQRVLDGDTTIKPTPTELKHIVRTLHARGLTDAQIASRTNTKHNTIQATRQRLGLPLNPANLNWAEFGIKPRVRPHRKRAA